MDIALAIIDHCALPDSRSISLESGSSEMAELLISLDVLTATEFETEIFERPTRPKFFILSSTDATNSMWITLKNSNSRTIIMNNRIVDGMVMARTRPRSIPDA
eukprot:1129645_1